MKTPTWGYVAGIFLMLLGGCGGMKDTQLIVMPAVMDVEKDVFKDLNFPTQTKIDTSVDSSGTNQADTSIQAKHKIGGPFFKKPLNIEKLLSIPQAERIWMVRFGYLGFIPSMLCLLAGIFLIVRRTFSVKLAYCALVINIAFVIIRNVVLASYSSGSIIGIAMGLDGLLGTMVAVVLIIVMAVSDKSAYAAEDNSSETV